MARALNEFEKSLLANHPHFYASLEIAAREKARIIKNVESIPGYSAEVLANCKIIADGMLKNSNNSPLREPKEFAKMFLQLHTADDIEVDSGNAALDVTNVVVTHFVGDGGDFGIYLDDVFKLLGEV